MATATEHRRDLAQLTAIAERDLRTLFGSLKEARQAQEALKDVLPRLVQVYGAAAATLAADWYDERRDILGIDGKFTAIPAEYVADGGRTESLAGWSASPLYRSEPDWSTALSRVIGGTQLLIADADRATVIGSVAQDPQASGWSRETDGNACDFCSAIAARGAVFSAETADFGAHDRCGCVAVSEFGVTSVKAFTPSQRFRTESARAAHLARTRTWLAA